MYAKKGLSIIRLADGAAIPAARGNVDYEEYLQWVDAGNSPTSGVTADEERALKWEAIKLERDRRRFDGGVKVGDHWYLSTAIATSEYNSLILISAGLPEHTVLRAGWRTMDGAAVDMTPALVKQIIVAGFAQVAAIDDASQAHKAAMLAAAAPADYDFSQGWPQTYAEYVAAQQAGE